MSGSLKKLDQKLAGIDIWKKMSAEKRHELADAIYMSSLRSNLDVDEVIKIIRTKDALKETFFEATEGNIFSFVPAKYRSFAKRLFIKRAGGGTPNAAMGKTELLLLLLSDKTKKPVKGDISFKGRNIEIKTNGGKFGIGSGEAANRGVVDFCVSEGIPLRKGASGKAAKNKPVFDPTKESDRELVSGRLSEVLAIWWAGLSGQDMAEATWPKVRKAFLEIVANEYLVKPGTELLAFANDGRFRLFKNAEDFVNYYDNENTRYEYRAYQKNPFSIYIDVWGKKLKKS